mmetsp:Transcript_39435/g.84451  ORF Transcript_39435/g.84451 Transcript_39435/m.84451 type:complete len:546 (-) Transcript_39435:1157-2794(-)
MEVHSAPREPTDEGVHLVRVLDVKRRVLQELLHDLEVALNVAARLKTQPLEHHEGLVRPLCVEGLEGVLPVLARVSTDGTEGCHLVSHVGSLLERGVQQGLDLGVRVSKLSKVGKSTVPDGPSGLALSVRLVIRLDVALLVGLEELVPHASGQALQHKAADGVDVHGVGLVNLIRQLFGGGQGQREGPELLVERVVREKLGEGLRHAVVHLHLLALLVVRQQLKDEPGGEPLASLPLVERVRVVREQELERVVRLLDDELDGGGEVAQDARGGLHGDVGEGEGLAPLGHLQHVGGLPVEGLSLATLGPRDGGEGDVLPIWPHEADRDGDELRQLLLLHVRGLRDLLRAGQGEGLGASIVGSGHLERGGARLLVPELEGSQGRLVGVLHGGVEVVGGHGLAVVPLEVEVHALPEALAAKQGVVHANDLRPLVVDSEGVEVVDLHVRRGPDRVRHGAGVLGELPRADDHHVLDPLHGSRVHVGRELLVPEDREPLLERKLEPVPARDPVARPVVEVLVADHALDSVVVHVRRRLRGAQHQPRVEDVQ